MNDDVPIWFAAVLAFAVLGSMAWPLAIRAEAWAARRAAGRRSCGPVCILGLAVAAWMAGWAVFSIIWGVLVR